MSRQKRALDWHWSLIMVVVVAAVVGVLGWVVPAQERNSQRSRSLLNQGVELTASPEPVTLLVTGDVMLGRHVNYFTTSQNDFEWPWREMADLLWEADITFINLELPLIPNCPVTRTGMKFCGDQRHVQGLQLAGVDVAALANNHSENYGLEGLWETRNLLQESGIAPVGLGEPVVLEHEGTRFSFLAYDDVARHSADGAAAADEDQVRADVAAARTQAEVVVVLYHWGVEYTHRPTARQRELAHLTIDAGADLVLGNHPHWVQPMERYKDKVIVYSHGNFIFDQNWSRKTSQGVVGRYVFTGPHLTEVSFVPIVIEQNSQPRLADRAVADEILAIMEGRE